MQGKALTLAVCGIILGSAAHADAQSRRDGRWESSVQLLYSSSENFSGDRQSKVDIDSDIGLGFGIAYNFSEHLSVGGEFLYLAPDYEAVFNTDEAGLVSVDHEMDIFSGQFGATWNFLDKAFTPFVSAGLGWTYVDSNIADGPPVTGCWWDPFWGYICDTYYDSYDDTSFSYSVAAGLRYELNNDMLLKATINHTEIDGDEGFDPSLDIFKIELGWMF